MEEEKMKGAQLSAEYRDRLAAVLSFYRRTFRAQLEAWIDDETRVIQRQRG